MTPRTADRPQPQMSIEEFEELERRAPEMVRLEFLNGKVQVKAVPDGETCSVTVHAEPEDGVYRAVTTRPFGAVVELPDPVGITLETEKLKDYVD
ncbi:hypothetical protein [Streptomyces sp. NBC_01429]|uniref:hypothetical protein n=1 Tax=Streptomyces sp. NBC_01429 TaxID=2903862 RepID=UPI002E2813FC|nr:hypothetical protein [Streptomyces sp. NBC_01429]